MPKLKQLFPVKIDASKLKETIVSFNFDASKLKETIVSFCASICTKETIAVNFVHQLIQRKQLLLILKINFQRKQLFLWKLMCIN